MLKIVAVVLLTLSGLFAIFWLVSSDITEEDRRLTKKLLDAQTLSLPVHDLYPGNWDYVCYIDPYSYPSESLKKRLPVAIPGLSMLPADRWVDEERWGLTFVTKSPAQARVFLINNRSIYRFEGPWCVTREAGAFKVETVAALNLTYKRLTLVHDRPDSHAVTPIH